MRGIVQTISNFIEAQRLLFRFLLGDGWKLLAEVTAAYDNPRRVTVATSGGGSTTSTQYLFNRSVIDAYNRRYDELKQELRKLVRTRGYFGRVYLFPLIAVRACTVVSAAKFGLLATFLTSLLQFVVAPYSFFASFAMWIGIAPFYVIHFALFAVLQSATWVLYSHYPVVPGYLRVPITPMIIAGWFALDQLLCLLLCFWTPIGRPVRCSPKQFLQSFAYGILNCKTYWLVLLLCLRGFKIDVLAWRSMRSFRFT